jgi:hypothetical protein
MRTISNFSLLAIVQIAGKLVAQAGRSSACA